MHPPKDAPESQKLRELRRDLDVKIDAYSERMVAMSDWMYHNPEPGFEEFKAVDLLTGELRKHGFDVETGVPNLDEVWPEFDDLKYVGGLPRSYAGPPGLPTAFRSRLRGDDAVPTVAFVVEYDALRGDPPFHGCQHNMQGPTGIGAAIALAEILVEKNLPGNVWVVGAPAEEVGPPTKAAFARAGYLDGVDIALRSHGTDWWENATVRDPGGFSFRHITKVKYTFYGQSAHAEQPWAGISALDGALLFYHASEMLRKRSQPQFRFHGIIDEGGVASNIVPERASATMAIRHLVDETKVGSVTPMQAGKLIDEKLRQLDDAARGAALATGTRLDIDHYGTAVPSISVGALNDIVFQYAKSYGGIHLKENKVPRHWEETGFLSLKVPGALVGIGTEGIPRYSEGHSQAHADLTITQAGHKSLVSTAKVMAATALRLILEPELLAAVKAEHACRLEEYYRE